MREVSVTRPVSVWNKPLKTDFRKLFVALGRAAAHAAQRRGRAEASAWRTAWWSAGCRSGSPQLARAGASERLPDRPGYEDAWHLRHDPLPLSACDRAPDDAEGLSSQPTLSRFESGVGPRELRRALALLEDSYDGSLAPDATQVILDIDSTHDPTRGQQQLSFFRGYSDESAYHPLLVFDGTTGQLATAVLHPGRCHYR